MSGDLAKELEIHEKSFSEGFDFKIFIGLWEKETQILRTQKNLICTKAQGEGVVTPQMTAPDLSSRWVCESPMEA